MFQRFTERARNVVVLAQDEARALKHDYIGTEHLLLGLLREEEGVAARVLWGLDVSADEVRTQVGRTIGTGNHSPSGQIPFTPRAKKVLELALRVALSMGDDSIDTEHLLLGLLEVRDGLAARLLDDFGVQPEQVRAEIMRLRGWTGYVSPAQEPPIRLRGGDVLVVRRGHLMLLLAAFAGAAIFAAGLLAGWLVWG